VGSLPEHPTKLHVCGIVCGIPRTFDAASVPLQRPFPVKDPTDVPPSSNKRLAKTLYWWLPMGRLRAPWGAHVARFLGAFWALFGRSSAQLPRISGGFRGPLDECRGPVMFIDVAEALAVSVGACVMYLFHDAGTHRSPPILQ